MAYPSDHSLSCDHAYHHLHEQAEKLREELKSLERARDNVLLMKHGRVHPEHPDKIFYIAESFNVMDNDRTLKYSSWQDYGIRYSSDIPVEKWEELTPIPLFKPLRYCKVCGVSDWEHKDYIGYYDTVGLNPDDYSDHKSVY